jgi:hypothetical protein
MQTSIIYPLEALTVTLIGAVVGCLIAPGYPDIPFELAESAYAFLGAIIGATGWFVVLLVQQSWGNAAFRFTTRELILLTVIVALICGWAVDHAKGQREIWRLQSQLIHGLAPSAGRLKSQPCLESATEKFSYCCFAAA